VGSAASEPAPHLSTVIIDGIVHVKQEPDFCGEACVEMWARHLGMTYDQDAVFAATGLQPALGRGAYTPDLVRAVNALGFAPSNVYTLIDAAHPQAGLARELDRLHADLERGVASIVCMHYSDHPHTTEHFRLMIGYDADKDELVYQEPAEDRGGYRRMTRTLFEKLWQLPSSDPAKRVLVRIPLAAGKLVDPPVDSAPAAYAQHVMALREQLDGTDLRSASIRVEPPFVVIGDAGAAILASDVRTVKWTVDLLEHDFFTTRPRKIIDIYLFHGDRSYRRGVQALTTEAPDTPYGFYSPAHGALFMNIETGGGTLVHEIVHPYVEADLPDAPPWLNEGLGSLFEQSAQQGGHIVGRTNWRLAGLQRALATGEVPSFRTLLALDRDAFYRDGSAVNYAASRYLLYYLQEQGKLRDFYRAFRIGRTKDPTGYATLADTLGERDMDAFRARWENFVTALKLP
jgi:hypothetical protein